MVMVLSRPKRPVRAGSRPYRELGQRVKALREAAGLSQPELARRVGISSGYPPSIESGRVRPDAGVLQNIAKETGADYEELGVLAGYLKPRPPDVKITGSGPRAAALRRLNELTA